MRDGSADDVSISYDAAEETYRARFDPDDIVPSLAVVEVVAYARETTPTDLEPLVNTVDPMAMDHLVADGAGTERTVEFRYLGYEVSVDSRGVIEVQAPDAAAD
mgnify:FL=1